MTWFSFTWTDESGRQPHSVVLSDPTGAYGIRRTDTGQVLVEAEEPMVHNGSGNYSYDLTDLDETVTYEAWIRINAVKKYFIHRFLKSPLRLLPGDQSIDSAALVIATVLQQLNHVSNASEINPNDKDNKPVWPCGIGSQEESPSEFVTLYDTGGITDGIMQTKNGPVLVQHLDVQIRTRAEYGDYMVAKRKLRQIKDDLLRVKNLTVSVSTEESSESPEQIMVNAITVMAVETYVGPDDKKRPMFSLNIRTTMQKVQI